VTAGWSKEGTRAESRNRTRRIPGFIVSGKTRKGKKARQTFRDEREENEVTNEGPLITGKNALRHPQERAGQNAEGKAEKEKSLGEKRVYAMACEKDSAVRDGDLPKKKRTRGEKKRGK